MKRVNTNMIMALVLVLGWSLAISQSLPGLRVDGRFLYDRCGEKIIPVGLNEMAIWDGNNPTGSGFLSQVEKTGANMIRLSWMPSGSAANLDKLIENTLAAKMIPMPELHGATGDLNKLGSQVDYWVRSDVAAVIQKYERDILVNIANESGNFQVTNQQFIDAYKTAITRMRNAGYKVPLVIDAPGWGQTIDVLQATWQSLQDHDPLHNLLFSVHTWWVNSSDGSRGRMTTELKQSADMGLPLIVGEFAPMGVQCSRYIDYKFLMSEALKYDIGWLAWSWGKVGNGDCSEMSMTTDGVFGNWRNTPNDGKWGEVVSVTDPNSIKNKSVRPYSIVNGTCANADGPFTLTTSITGPGSVSQVPQADQYSKGTRVTLTATPNPGITFVGWSGAVTSTDLTIELLMDRDRQVTAMFRDPNQVVNLIRNGDFTNGSTEWTVGQWNGGVASLSTTGGEAQISVSNPGIANWHVQLLQSGLSLVAGSSYTLRFKASAQSAVSIAIAIGQNESPYSKYLEESSSITTTMTQFEYSFTASETNANARLEFNLGNTGANAFTLDDIMLVSNGETPTLMGGHGIQRSNTNETRLLFQNGKLWIKQQHQSLPFDFLGRQSFR